MRLQWAIFSPFYKESAFSAWGPEEFSVYFQKRSLGLFLMYLPVLIWFGFGLQFVSLTLSSLFS